MSEGRLNKNVVKDAVREVLREQDIVKKEELERSIEAALKKQQVSVEAESNDSLMDRIKNLQFIPTLKKIGVHLLLFLAIIFSCGFLSASYSIVTTPQEAVANAETELKEESEETQSSRNIIKEIVKNPQLIGVFLIFIMLTTVFIFSAIKLYDIAKVNSSTFTNAYCIAVCTYGFKLFNSPLIDIAEGLLGNI